MKIDLLTIFPGIVLETQKWNWGKEVQDPDAYNDITFGNTHIISYKKLQYDPNILGKKYVKHINEIHEKVIDSKGDKLTDYTIILDKSVDSKSLESPTPDSQQLITYFSYLQHLNFWVSIDFIKILCFKSGGRYILLNNQGEHWTPKYSFLLPIEQTHKGKIKIHKNREKLLIDVLSKISKRKPAEYKRLINAISLFNESCRINQFSPNSSIVLIVSAFESLLNLPKGYGKRKNFVYAFKVFWGFNKRIEEWAGQLYELRSQIVHGDVTEGEKLMASKDHHYPHVKIARDIFHDCLLFILEGYGNITVDRKYKSEVIKDLTNKIVSNKEKVRWILDHKNNFSYQAFVQNKDLYREFILRLETLTPADDSARDDILKLLDLIFSIAETWINDEKVKYNHSSVAGYIDFRNQKFDNVVKIFAAIRRVKWSLNGQLHLSNKIRDLQEEVRQLEPIVHDKDKFEFTIPEFLDRCLRAMFFVY